MYDTSGESRQFDDCSRFAATSATLEFDGLVIPNCHQMEDSFDRGRSPTSTDHEYGIRFSHRGFGSNGCILSDTSSRRSNDRTYMVCVM